MTIAINLKSIRIDGGTQARVAINEDVVASYAEAMTEGATLPPVVIFRDGTDDWLADGFHRYHAHARIGAVSIDAEILTGTRRDAVLYSVGANGRHGLPPNNADKRKAVTALLSDAEWSTWSDREIAKRCEVGHPFVAKLRKELSLESDSSEESTQRTYTTKHGTQSTMDTAGQKDSAAKKAANGKPAATTAATPRERDDAPSAATVTTAEPAQAAKPDAQDNDKKSLAELLIAEQDAHRETLADNAAMGLIFDADDKLATAVAENKKLRAEVSGLRERVNGLLGEKNEAIRLMKSWRRKAEKAEQGQQA